MSIVPRLRRRPAALAAGLLIGCLALTSGCHHNSGSPSSPMGKPVASPPMVSASVPPLRSLAGWVPVPRLFVRGDRTQPKVALTFDAGADAKAVPLILQTLQAHHVHCTFFLTGRFCQHFPQQCRMIADAGMELGNHSFYHPKFTKLSDDKVRDQLERGEAEIVKACGRGAKPLFRFPYGDSNGRVQRAVAADGYQAIHWTLDSLDAFGKPKSEAFVEKRIIARIKPGYITLMHVSCMTSAEALEPIFQSLDARHIQVVPVSELLLDQPARQRTVSR